MLSSKVLSPVSATIRRCLILLLTTAVGAILVTILAYLAHAWSLSPGDQGRQAPFQVLLNDPFVWRGVLVFMLSGWVLLLGLAFVFVDTRDVVRVASWTLGICSCTIVLSAIAAPKMIIPATFILAAGSTITLGIRSRIRGRKGAGQVMP